MKTRVITSAVGIAFLVLVMFFFDTVFFELVITVLCLLALHEIYKAFQLEKAFYVYLGLIPYVALIMFNNYKYAKMALLPISYLFVLFLAVCLILNSKTLNFAKLSGMVVFSGIVIFCFFSLIYLKRLLPRADYNFDAIYFILLILGYAWGGDTAAYFAGCAFGKHKMAPVVSPHKTWEGAVGGVLGSIVAGVAITAVYAALNGGIVGLPMKELGWQYYLLIIALGFIASILGILGDLFASAVKRQCGIKDYGTIFPGHGGILDRFDSVMFIAPVVAMIVTVVFYLYSGVKLG